LLDLINIGRRHTLDQIELAGLKVCKANRGIDHRRELDALDRNLVSLEIVRVLLENDAGLRDAAHELVGAGAGRTVAEAFPERLAGLWRDHHSRAVSEDRR